MRFKFYIASFLFAMIGQSTMAQENPCKEPASAFLGALFKGVIDVACEDSAEIKPPPQVRKKDPFGRPFLSTDDVRIINKKAFESWIAAGRDHHNGNKHCEMAAENLTGIKYRPQPCLEFLHKAVSADVEKKRASANAAFTKEREDQGINRAAAQASMREQSEAIARRIEAGDASAWRNCSKEPSGSDTSVEFYNTCVPIAEPAFIRALRDKKFPPDNCRKWGLANTHEGKTLSNAMRVSIGSDGKLGSFSGEVTQIYGKTLALYNRDTSSNAIVVVDGKTQVFNGDRVAVGLAIYGVGIQTSTRQVKLASGLASSVAVISAKCIGDF